MTKTKALFMAAVIAAAILPATSFGNVTITYTSPIGELGETSSGGNMTQATFTFALGVFNGITPNSGNMASWVTDFSSLQTSAWQDDPGPGTGEISANYTLPISSTFGGDQAYIWGYNNGSPALATQWILLTNTSWTMPYPSLGNPPPTEWATTDTGTHAVDGYLSSTPSGGSSVYLKSAPVPEPSSLALAGFGVVAMLAAAKSRLRRS